eukprot:INCI15977.1.p1 GENE.INCI15977.1~~INCI15977.1.p1  ORF type:complete len:237 (+),score=6.69 INCI15977.1:93-713(+)
MTSGGWGQLLRGGGIAYLRAVAITVPVALFAQEYLGCPGKVRGNSMYPTLNGLSAGTFRAGRDVVWLSPHRSADMRRGQIVILRQPANPRKLILKRVTALPGDCVAAGRGRGRPIVVPSGHVWVEGDNASCSHDSTQFGAVPIGLVVGSTSTVIWPLARIGRIDSQVPLDVPLGTHEKAHSSSSLVGRLLHTDGDWLWAEGPDAVP